MKISMRFFVVSAVMMLPSLLWGCSSADSCRSGYYFTIEYYSGGGFTGVEHGLTIQSNGNVRKWTRHAGSTLVYTDSLTLRSADLDKLSTLMTKNDTLGYTRSEKGNYTTVITLTSNNKSNVISFPGLDAPGDVPQYVIDLIAVIKKIINYQEESK
jgi:hypothetical protein